MACDYCDEADKRSEEMSLANILKEVARLERTAGPRACVSLTGGEPLLYADFLRSLCERLKNKKYRVLLETSGILWRKLPNMLPVCDIIAMDLKLPSVTKQKDFTEEHRKFLRIAKGKEFYIKVVISRDVDLREYKQHLRMVAKVAPRAPVFLQPVSGGKGRYPDPALMKHLDQLQRIGTEILGDVRVGIQLHKLMNIKYGEYREDR